MKNKELPKIGMSLIVKTVSLRLKGFILVYGIYIVLYGHLTPGGGFAGGVIVALAFVLATLAEGNKTVNQRFRKTAASKLDSIGALFFLVIATLGITAAGVFFANFIPTSPENYFSIFSSGIIPFCNIGIGLKVGSSLFLVFTVLAAFRLTEEGEKP